MNELLHLEYTRRRERLLPARACLLLVDIQERLLAAMPGEVAARTVKNAQILIETCAALWVPIVVTRQYPKGLGPTAAPVAEALEAVKARGLKVFELDKLAFSAVEAEGFHALEPAELEGAKTKREQWIVCGMETHVCVYQTVRDLMLPTYAVHVVSDAVASRTKANWKLGLDLCRETGARITSTEVVAFDLLQKAGTDQFKAVSKLIK